MDNNKSFEIDWKFSAEDFIYNAEQIVGKLPLEYVGEREVLGVWFEVVKADGKEVLFKRDMSPQSLEDIIDLINNHLTDKKFEYYDTGGDSYGFKLVEGGVVVTQRSIPEISRTTPAASKYFILYVVKSKNTTTNQDIMLLLENGATFASKVNVGETLVSVVDREIVDLTGSKEYTLESVSEHDQANDRFGNSLKRYALYITIPYFDTTARKTKYPMKWI